MISHPHRLRIWLYGTKSYATFAQGPIAPDWVWRSRKFFEWVRGGLISPAKDLDGDAIVTPELGNDIARELGCWWFGLDIKGVGSNASMRAYALVPRLRIPEVVEALGVKNPALLHFVLAEPAGAVS